MGIAAVAIHTPIPCMTYFVGQGKICGSVPQISNMGAERKDQQSRRLFCIAGSQYRMTYFLSVPPNCIPTCWVKSKADGAIT